MSRLLVSIGVGGLGVSEEKEDVREFTDGVDLCELEDLALWGKGCGDNGGYGKYVDAILV
jgi:hypothetical protein